MKEKYLVIQRDADEQQVALKKERFVIGRDNSCDVIWNEAEFSREHVVIHNKHEAVYIENVSTGGSMKINGKDSEYAELREGMEVNVGPYVIKWIFSDGLNQAAAPHVAHNDSGVKAFGDLASDGNSAEEPTNPSSSNEESGNSLEGLAENLPVLESTVQSESGDLEMSPEVVEAIASDDTVTQISAAVGMMKIISGEIAGREIRLEHGKEWIVGRARECHVSIDNPKLSRHHFRIVQIGGGFRVQDLDSSYGVKINGVGVKDAPIKSFDKIVAGPVEMQFVIVDKNLKDLADIAPPQLEAPQGAAALPSLMRDEAAAHYGASPRMHNEKTNWPPAVNGAPPPHGGFQFSRPSLENSNSQGNFVSVPDPAKKTLPRDSILNIFQNFKDQPTSRKLLVTLLPILILLGALSTLAPEEKTEAVAKTETKEEKEKKEEVTEENPAESQDFSPEYQVKSVKEKNEIQALYAQAEEARTKGDWQRAYDLAKEVISKAGKYKKASDIIAEAQGYLTDLQIATLSRTDADADSAAAATKQKVEDLLKRGEEALNEKRWDDAEEIYSKALLYDPKNDKATRGQYAAKAKDATALGKAVPLEREIAQQKPVEKAAVSSAAPEEPRARTPEESLEAMSTDYQIAKQKIQEGAYRDALPMLNVLKSNIERMIAEDESTRNPAALIAEDKRNMRSKIMESLDLINDQFVLEYKTQMDDAQQAIANQKYVEARAIYDTIVKREPLFEEPKVEREKLYKKMMSDGQTAYREGLVSESVGDLSTAMEYYEKAKSYFESIDKKDAEEYYAILDKKLRVLKK